MRRFSTRLLVVLLGAAVVVGASIYLYRHPPTNSASLYPACSVRRLTGFDCAGCGLTRASHELLHLRIGKAIGYNPLVVLASPLLVLWVLLEVAQWLWGARYRGPRLKVGKRAAIVMVSVVLIYTVLRNIPVWPLTLLAPG